MALNTFVQILGYTLYNSIHTIIGRPLIIAELLNTASTRYRSVVIGRHVFVGILDTSKS